MEIYIPKFTDLFVREPIGSKIGFSGEYRAILRAENGEIKHDSGWLPNTLLNNGLKNLRDQDSFSQLVLGTSDTAVDITQTGILGTYIYKSSLGSPQSYVNNGAPNYESVIVEQAVFTAGYGTGLIKEFTLAPNNTDYANNATVRVVLTTPINKGAQDQLTMQHRLTFYPDLNDYTGVIDISGVAYNYLLRAFRCESVHRSYPTYIGPPYWGNGWCYNDEPPAVVGEDFHHGGQNTYIGSSVETVGGSGPGTWYRNSELKVALDNGNFAAGLRRIGGGYRGTNVNNGAYGMNLRIGKVSDDSAIMKTNTHTVTLHMRTYPQRYVP